MVVAVEVVEVVETETVNVVEEEMEEVKVVMTLYFVLNLRYCFQSLKKVELMVLELKEEKVVKHSNRLLQTICYHSLVWDVLH